MNLDFDMGESSQANDHNDQVSPHQQLEVSTKLDRLDRQHLPITRLVQPEPGHVLAATENTENLDVKAELDSLLASLQIATTPCSPTRELVAESYDSDSFSVVDISAIDSAVSIDHQPQLAIEQTTATQSAATSIDIQSMLQEHQSQLAEIDRRLLAAKQLEFQTQQLAQHNQIRFEQAEQLLSSISQVHADIVASLAEFGGQAEIQTLLAQLETTRHSLIIAHDRATTGQAAFYDSLRTIESDVANRSAESEHKLSAYQSLIEGLSQTIATDRLQIASTNSELRTKLIDLQNLNTQVAATHTELIATEQLVQSRITTIDRNFIELIASVQNEKEQFYELTAEAIEKAEAVKSQLANISQQISADRESIELLRTELASVKNTIQQEHRQQLNNLDIHYQQLISSWDDFQTRQKDRLFNGHKLTRWLWILSGAVVCIFVMLIRVLMIIK